MRESDPDWPKHERELQEWLGLSSTIGSGNKWHDISDGSTKGLEEIVLPLMIDCKATRKKSYSLNRDFFKEWIVKARGFGRHFMMPVRFEEDGKKDFDLMVVPMPLFLSMYQSYIGESDDAARGFEFFERLVENIKNPSLKVKAQQHLSDIRGKDAEE